MDLNLSKGGFRRESLSTLCTDLFLIVIKMRDAEDLGETKALRKLIFYFITQFEKNCSAIGIAQQTTEAVKYALIALLDETVLSVPGEARDVWIVNPMQLEIYGDNIAGKEFYEKLDLLLQEPAKNLDALEVFYLCLSLGFEGKYKIGNAEEREEKIRDLARTLIKLDKNRIDSLSPHAIRMSVAKKKKGVQKTGILPLWVFGSALTSILIIAWFVMRFISLDSAKFVTELISR
ncbi:type IVB secretion system protein IcmH/DotU [Chitinispirillales bacterium ANBcel5]|uniref:type IVB secretion system protein IcmH/DotU n=1 Tax=Cellulosispirillum alkaliphilum TaxID=3039283 RepID=UPI002A58D2A4|nr:type IVB secretion system protein IcmH/DotU [Chitinispirillales bacterium ANBcel5]